MSPIDVAPDDIVRTAAEGAANEREPLLVLDPLAAFLDEQGLGSGDLQVEPVGDGHSNVTYAITRDDGTEVIVRRPPRGPLPPSAHDVLREARVLRALEGQARVPKVLAVSEGGVIGCPFYVMERVQGHVLTTAVPAELDSVEDRRRMGEELVDALVEVHAIDWQAAGLEGFGKPTGYLERQLKRFLGLWEHNKTREIPQVETVADWLKANFPDPNPPTPSTVVHGDYRLGNTMFAPDAPARLNAIFDWEMSTIGDPLADLGYMCTIWIDRGDPSLGMFELNGITRQEGFPLRAELIARYEERSGRSMTDIRWYQTLALWKSIVFMEGNYKRAVAGATDDPYLKGFGEGVVQLAQRAEALTRG
jgi:aminoglycoside phosphotransferase (APT) family kinase protein